MWIRLQYQLHEGVDNLFEFKVKSEKKNFFWNVYILEYMKLRDTLLQMWFTGCIHAV